MTFVALPIVNDVSYETRINHASFYLAGAGFPEVQV